MAPLKLHWAEPLADPRELVLFETLLREYFAQDPAIVEVILRPIARGRSGAVPVVAAPQALKVGKPTSLQPEFVKLAKDGREVKQFEDLAAETTLVFGKKLARRPYFDPGSGLTAFGFQLFENGTEVGPLYATAHVDTGRACRCLSDLCTRLTDWYALGSATDSRDVSLGADESYLKGLVQNLAALSPASAQLVQQALDSFRATNVAATVSRVHGDLHLENTLVPQFGDYCYLIDFGNASNSGSPCMDLARLEADLIYRLLPYDLGPDEVATFERQLWRGEFDEIQNHSAGQLITTLRRTGIVLGSTNAPSWFIVGRIMHGLRMLANTWTALRPYNFGSRRQGIATSLGVLGEVLLSTLAGKPPAILAPSMTKTVQPAEGLRLLRWLYINRHYDEAFDLGCALNKANPKGLPVVPLLGAIAGLSTSRPIASLDLLYASAATRARLPLESGLKQLYCAARLYKASPPSKLRTVIRMFEKANLLLEGCSDAIYAGIAKDQLARCHQEFGDLESAKIAFNDSIAFKKVANDRSGVAVSLGGLAFLELSTANYVESHNLLKQDRELAIELKDIRAEIKIENWLGQVVLLKELDLVGSIGHFENSIQLANQCADQDASYTSEVDLAFAYLGAGFTHCFLASVTRVISCEDAVQCLLPSIKGMSGEYLAPLVELMSGHRLCVQGSAQRSIIRCTGALNHLLSLSKIYYCDYALRTAKFYSFSGHASIASKLVPKARKVAAELKQSHMYKMLGAFEVKA